MKETHIECAGAGKTYGIAVKIVEMLRQCPKGMKIYAITYTNYAVSQIKGEIFKQLNYIPDEVVIDTVHGFLLEHIIYPFSPYVKRIPIYSCSIEKLGNDIKWKRSRMKQLKDAGIIHSDAVTQYAKSLLVFQSGDNKIVKQRKEIAMRYLVSDLFCLFVDESQDMDEDFFELMKVLLSQIENYCFVGDPNQDLWGKNQYCGFLDFVKETYDIEPILKLSSRRIPQSVIPLCNKILRPEYQITSSNARQGNVEYIFASELGDVEKNILSGNTTFSMIKSNTGIFVTKPEKAFTLPYEFKKILHEKFETFDLDAIVMTFTEIIKQDGLSNFLYDYGIHIDRKTYAKVANQFSSADAGEVHVNSIHKLKGLENEAVYFIICNSLLEILLGLKNEYNKETNLLYVALTRTKSRLLLIVLDDNTTKKTFETLGVNIESALSQTGVLHADISTWF